MPLRHIDARLATSLVLLTFFVALERASSAQDAPTDSVLSQGRVSVVESGEYVVSLDASGAHSGMVTLRFRANADGTIASGWFGAVLAHAETLNEDGTVGHEEHVEESGDSEPHADRMRLVNRGTVSGSITGGQIGRSPSGALTLTGLQLAVETGTLEFDGAAGWGVVDVNLSDAAAQGTLRLVF